jgi:hypothetical protein
MKLLNILVRKESKPSEIKASMHNSNNELTQQNNE